MKAARLNVTTLVLANLLGLPPEASIVSVFQDANDLAHGTVSLIIHGAGRDMTEGSVVQLMTVDELYDVKPPVDPVSVPPPAAPIEPDKFNKRT